MGFLGFLEVVITSNLGGPVGGLVGWVRFQEVSGGYNLQNQAWTFADGPYIPGHSWCRPQPENELPTTNIQF